MTSIIKSLNQTQRLFEKELKKYKKLQDRSFSTKLPTFSADFQKFNKMIGYPTNRMSNKAQKLAPFQIQYHNAIQKFHRVIVNKSRKIGATETAIRSIAYNVFDRYAGHDIMIVAGNELRIAIEILIRFNELFLDKLSLGYSFKEPGKDGNKWRYNEIVRKCTFGNSPLIEFSNDTRVFAYATNKSGKRQSFRGPDDVICIFLSEAAHIGLKNDQPVMDALEPNLANRDDGDIILESTPNGRRGFFYFYWKNAIEMIKRYYPLTNEKELLEKLSKNDNVGIKMDWYPLMWDYNVGIKHKICRSFLG